MWNWRPENLGSTCRLCGRFLPPGELKYVVKIEIWADFDGYLSGKDDPAEMEKILKEALHANPEDLEAQVYQIQYLLICPSCRKDFLRNTPKENISTCPLPPSSH